MDTVAKSISPDQLAAVLGSADAPLILDVRSEKRFIESERILPGARRCTPDDMARLAAASSPGRAIIYCVHGLEVSRQAARDLRATGWTAMYLQGGIEGLIERGSPTLRKRRDLGVTGEQASRWITRERPKIDRIACPWLVRRFIDPRAEFFYVPTERVVEEGRLLQAVPYDIPGAPISHEGELCSFDTLLRAFDLQEPCLLALARIVRGADTGRLDLTPQSAGLLAVSLGLSRLHTDDHSMLEAALPVYDALYAWLRGAPTQTHGWNPDLMKGTLR